MQENKYIAHKKEDGSEQTVIEHLSGTAELCAKFAKSFGAEETGRLCGMAHDLGKYSEGFQHRILENGPKVDHASAGAIECWKMRNAPAAMCVMGHHGGIMNLGASDATSSDNSFYGRIKRYTTTKSYDYSAWKNECALPPSPPPALTSYLQLSFYTRMLYSCLVDADFLDTASFMGEPRDSITANWDKLNADFDSYTERWYPPKSELNIQRCAILDKCKEEGEKSVSSLYTLTVPTGGGKTAASLAFALRHARATGKDRIIYVIPYTSIIEQTASEFRKMLGSEVVLEHHSGIVYDDDESNTDSGLKQLKYATENWDMPIIVTTAVQFFESLYSNLPSRCRKLHNIANSVIIFDEAQMLPLSYLRPCVYAISQLAQGYRATAVLCTATQPSLDKLFNEYANNIPLREICPPELRRSNVFQRVRFEQIGKLQATELANRLNECKQVLCIVNSRTAAKEIFELLKDEEKYHLSTLMPPCERSRQIQIIRNKLKNGEPCRVVSTALIEAGVDLDFPTVYRELSGLDSVLQAAGRCNREGKRPIDSSAVFIFTSEWRAPTVLDTAIGVCRGIIQSNTALSDEQIIKKYFDAYLKVKSDSALDAHRILEKLNYSVLPFEEVAQEFALIESSSSTVYIPTAESTPLIERYKNGDVSRSLIRKLGLYGVTVYPHHLENLINAGDIEVLAGDFYVLRNPELYSEQTGLSLKADFGKANFI